MKPAKINVKMMGKFYSHYTGTIFEPKISGDYFLNSRKLRRFVSACLRIYLNVTDYQLHSYESSIH